MSLLDIYCILIITSFVTDISNIIKIKFNAIINKEHFSLGRIIKIYFNNMNIIYNIIPLINIKKARDRKKKYYKSIEMFNETFNNIINIGDNIGNNDKPQINNVAISFDDAYKNGSVLLSCSNKSNNKIKLYPIKFYNEYPYLDKESYRFSDGFQLINDTNEMKEALSILSSELKKYSNEEINKILKKETIISLTKLQEGKYKVKKLTRK